MKHTKTATLLALTGSSILAISHASAALVSVDLKNGETQGTIANPSFGLWSQGSNIWNTLGLFNVTSTALQDSSGATTGITFTTVNVPGSAANWWNLTDDDLVRDGFYRATDADVMTTTISGLAVNTNYNLVVYHADDFESEAVTVNNTAGSDFTGSLGATGYADAFDGLGASDFWYFSSINSGATGVLTIRSGGVGFDTITGFQLQAIPEPSTALLGGLGMLALLRRRR